MSARFRFNNHHERKMYNRKKHRRKPGQGFVDDPEAERKIAHNKKADRRWKYKEGFDDEE